jgi:asparagine synthase (glutamine-hydrolysing)
MCGLVGIWSRNHYENLREQIESASGVLKHRGPDDSGTWIDGELGLALGHRRLSILDCSAAGHQPMHSHDDRYVTVFNGEIYNHLDLRAQLAADGITPAWRGHSDTETLLACFSAWGIKKTLQATVGMFAIVLWDRQTKVLTLARDRMGEKPLYWGWQNDTLVFTSELKALKSFFSFDGQVDRNALALLLRHGYIAAPYSIYQGIQKLPMGNFIDIPLSSREAAHGARPVAYWKMNESIQTGLDNPFTGTADHAVDALEQQLSQSIGAQMISDVPLGAFLSGGIDSSTIVALMQAQSERPVHTFTIGFEDKKYNEAEHAKVIAAHLGTHHTELYVSPEDALAVIPHLPRIYDEPFADSSQIPTFLLSRMAHEHVTVALSGDAGDELFGGYNTYRFTPSIWGKIGLLPAPLRRVAAASLTCLPTSAWDKALKVLQPVLPAKSRQSATGEKLHKLAELLSAGKKEAFYRQLVSHWKQPGDVVIGSTEHSTLLSDQGAWPQGLSFEHWMMAMDAQTYMTDDILVKVDRAAMANSLEVRVPMLDHRVVELAWRMPQDFKIRDGKGKWLLREVLYRHVPKELMERPKKGFSIPLANWLRGPLRDWAEALLNEARLRKEGYFRPYPIRQAWAQHLSGKRDNSRKLWCVLMFQAWLNQQADATPPVPPL